MPDINNNPENGTSDHASAGERGGFVALAVLAAALGAGAAVLLAPNKGSRTRKHFGGSNQSRRERRIIAVAGLLIGAGVAALLVPESGPQVRRRLGGTLGRLRVGAIDRIERLKLEREEVTDQAGKQKVRSIQELGRDPNNVF
jgi:gas vesicle protein